MNLGDRLLSLTCKLILYELILVDRECYKPVTVQDPLSETGVITSSLSSYGDTTTQGGGPTTSFITKGESSIKVQHCDGDIRSVILRLIPNIIEASRVYNFIIMFVMFCNSLIFFSHFQLAPQHHLTK